MGRAGEPATADVHWDFLVSAADDRPLLAWRFETSPLIATRALRAIELPPHRRLYLEYEGELSRDRGVVRRLERGAAQIESLEARRISVRLEAQQGPRAVELVRDDDGGWLATVRESHRPLRSG